MSAFDNVSISNLTALVMSLRNLKKGKGWIGACRRDLITPI